MRTEEYPKIMAEVKKLVSEGSTDEIKALAKAIQALSQDIEEHRTQHFARDSQRG